MSHLCMGGGGNYATREEIALVPTPEATSSWKPVPHYEVIEAVTEVVLAHQWVILEEQFGLARAGAKLFGVMKINRSSSLEWYRCIGLRNSHDKTFSVGLTAGITVICCSNMAFGGSMVLKRRHTSRIELCDLVNRAVDELENEFLILENVCEDLKVAYLDNVWTTTTKSEAESSEPQNSAQSTARILYRCTKNSKIPRTRSSWNRQDGAC